MIFQIGHAVQLKPEWGQGLSIIPVIPDLIRNPEFYQSGDVAGR